MNLNLLAATILILGASIATDPVAEQRKQDQIRLHSAAWMKLIREADDFTQKKQWTNAEQKLQQVLQERQQLGLDLSGEKSALAKLYANAGEKDKAEQFFKEVLKERETAYGDDDYTLIYPLNQYADFLKSVGRNSEATALTKRAEAIESDSRKPPTKKTQAITGDTSLSKEEKAQRLFALGKQFLDRDNALKARFALDQALTQNPKLVEAFIARAQASYQLEDLQKSLADLNKALALDPKNGAALANRAKIYQSLNKPQLALRDFSASIAVRPNDTDTLGYRAKQYDTLGLSAKAIADYSAVLKLSKDTRWALVQRALLYSRLKNYSAAIADLNRAIEIGPENADNYELRAETFVKANKLQDALKDANRMVELESDYTRGYTLRAKLYKAIEGDTSAKAADDLKRVAKLRAQKP
jgi:tetratricopeptide (TPR) repeat protein